MPTLSAPLSTSETASAAATRVRPASSIHLDMMRGLAALFVLGGHLRNLFFVDYQGIHSPTRAVKALYFLTGLGHTAVMVFFVLSGFFIASSVRRAVEKGRWGWAWYAEQRLTRLYVPLIPALLLGAAFDHLGPRLFGTHSVYGAMVQYHSLIARPVADSSGLREFLGNLFFVQGIWARPLGSNGSLWSLSYEFWYYALFPLLVFAALPKTPLVRRAAFLVLGLAVLALVGPQIRLYFLVWLMGAAVSVLPLGGRNARRDRAWLVGVWVALGVAVAALRLQFLPNGAASDFLISLIFSAVVFFLVRAGSVPCGGRVYAKTAGYLAGTSYSLYLLHLPFLVFLSAVLLGAGPRWQPNGAHLLMGGGLAAAAMVYTWVVWRFAESQTPALRQFIQRLSRN